MASGGIQTFRLDFHADEAVRRARKFFANLFTRGEQRRTVAYRAKHFPQSPSVSFCFCVSKTVRKPRSRAVRRPRHATRIVKPVSRFAENRETARRPRVHPKCPSFRTETRRARTTNRSSRLVVNTYTDGNIARAVRTRNDNGSERWWLACGRRYKRIRTFSCAVAVNFHIHTIS